MNKYKQVLEEIQELLETMTTPPDLDCFWCDDIEQCEECIDEGTDYGSFCSHRAKLMVLQKIDEVLND